MTHWELLEFSATVEEKATDVESSFANPLRMNLRLASELPSRLLRLKEPSAGPKN